MTDQLPVPVAPPMPLVKHQTLAYVQQLKLAAEVARDARPLAEILTTFELTQLQYEALLQTNFYSRVLTEAVKDWQSAGNTGERSKLAAAVFLEQALPMLGARAADEKEDLTKATEAAKLLAKVAQLDGSGNQQGSTEKFSITINMADGEKVKVIAGDAPSKTLEIRPLAEGESEGPEAQEDVLKLSANPETIQSEPKRD